MRDPLWFVKGLRVIALLALVAAVLAFYISVTEYQEQNKSIPVEESTKVGE